MTYASLLWDISNIVLYNAPLILFSIVGLLLAKKHNPIIWFIVGLFLMLISYYGNYYKITHISANSFAYINIDQAKAQFVYELIFTLLYFAITLYYALRSYKKSKNSRSENKYTGIEAQNYNQIIHYAESAYRPYDAKKQGRSTDNAKAVEFYSPLEYKRCPTCGVQLTKEALFCFNCGKRISREVIRRPRFCRSCGAKVECNYNYCKICGSRIGDI